MSGVVGIYRVKNEERWIGESLERTLLIVDRIILFDDHSTDSTREIARSMKNVTVVESPFSGLDEARDKDHLLSLVLPLNPDWIVQLDGDEVLSGRAVEETRTWVGQKNRGGLLFFRIAYLWDRTDQERVDGVFKNFCRPRAYSIFDQNTTRFSYRRTRFGGHFHCGQVPQGHTGQRIHMKYPIKHYGYLDNEDRERKYKWYNANDPNNKAEGGYLHILAKPNHHAPGPVEFVSFDDI